jgi:hypothetical protein
MKLTGENRSTRGKTCPSATLSTTNPTLADPGSNTGLRGGRLATNCLSHGTALISSLPVSEVDTSHERSPQQNVFTVSKLEYVHNKRHAYTMLYKPTANRMTWYFPGRLTMLSRTSVLNDNGENARTIQLVTYWQ